MSTEEILSRLVEDQLIERDIQVSILDDLLSHMRLRNSEARFDESSSRAAVHDLRGKYLFLGPNPNSQPTIRVTRVTNFDTVRRMLRNRLNVPWHWTAQRLAENSKFETYLSENIDVQALRNPPIGHAIFVTLSEDIEDIPLVDTVNGLGITHFNEMPVFAIDYDISSDQCYIPTSMDGNLERFFVSKPSADFETSRAWNWSSMCWGHRELVHGRNCDIRNVTVRYLGAASSTGRLRKSPFDRLAVEHSKSVEIAIASMLRKSIAHRDLEPFLSGKLDLLEIGHREFEHFLGTLYRRRGYEVEITKQSRDGGFDVIAISDRQQRKALLIQAKRTSKSVGISVVRELFGARLLAGPSLARHALVVATTGSFSAPVREVQKRFSSQLELLDLNRIRHMLGEFSNVGFRGIAEEAVDQIHASKNGNRTGISPSRQQE